MRINLLFFIIIIPIGLILIILSLIFKSKDNKMVRQCNQKTIGKVIKYTIWNTNGVHFPIIEYVVNDIKYNQRLKYGWIISKSSSFKKVKSEVENDVKGNNLIINRNAHIYTNVLQEKFPIETELDVYYNPRNPKKSYVMRFVKNPSVNILFFTGVFFVILSFAGLLFMPKSVIA